jgi:hypothetical protein
MTGLCFFRRPRMHRRTHPSQGHVGDPDDRRRMQRMDSWDEAKALLLVAEHDGPTMFARIGIMRALNRHVERVFNSDRKDQHWGRRKPARDR